MGQYLSIDTFLVGWTSIYQLSWGSLGTRVLTHPHMDVIRIDPKWIKWMCLKLDKHLQLLLEMLHRKPYGLTDHPMTGSFLRIWPGILWGHATWNHIEPTWCFFFMRKTTHRFDLFMVIYGFNTFFFVVKWDKWELLDDWVFFPSYMRYMFPVKYLSSAYLEGVGCDMKNTTSSRVKNCIWWVLIHSAMLPYFVVNPVPSGKLT